jgi:hypothetical protein
VSNLIIRKIDLSPTFQPLTASRTIGSFTFIVPGTSSGNVRILSDDNSTEVPLSRNDQFTLERVDLNRMIAKGDLGDSLIVIGATAK